MLIGASWPWNLSTVPTRASGGSAPADRADLGVVRRDDRGRPPSRRGVRTPCSVGPASRRPRRASRDEPRDGVGLVRRLVVGARRARRRATAGRCHRAVDAGASSRWRARCGSRLEPAVVEDLRGERAHVRMRRQVVSRNRPAVGGIVAASPRTCASAERSAPGGWLPWSGWSSCCGSPSRTRLSAAPGDGDHVRERDLAGLVDEQDVDRTRPSSATPTATPSPRRGSPRRRRAARGRPLASFAAARRAGRRGPAPSSPLLDRPDVDALVRRRLEDRRRAGCR